MRRAISALRTFFVAFRERMTIAEICEGYGVGQTELARRFAIPLRTVRDWYAGRRAPPAYVVTMMDEPLAMDREKE